MEQKHAAIDSTSAPGSAAAVLREFLALLIERYGRVENAAAPPGATPFDRTPGNLLLAEAALRYAPSAEGGDLQRPLQVAVLGPTQSGKSTVVNLLLGRAAAAVSPLAGYTVQPQGFWLRSAGVDQSWLEPLFPSLRRVEQEQLTRDRLDAFSVSVIEDREGELAGLPPCVIWDTPDFDSLAAGAYRGPVLESAALADAYVVVLSKEKYSDLSVWQMLQLLEPLGRPMLICLNKISDDAAETITASLRARLNELTREWSGVEIVRIRYVSHPAEIAAGALSEAAHTLRDRLSVMISRAAAGRDSKGVRRLIKRCWSEWLLPVRTEHEALAAWRGLVDSALEAALKSYRRDYLEHPQRWDSFRRATAELLHLLELPGVAGVLGHVRQVVTWPARKLVAMGKSMIARPAGGPRVSGEQSVIQAIIDEIIMSLQRDVARRRDTADRDAAAWRAIARRLETEREALTDRFCDAARVHHEAVKREIQEAAGQLYEKLKDRPAVLAALRTARVTADVASIALAIKSGGANLNDLIFAPAMFGLTSLLTEGALGGYMRHVAEGLKERQFEHVKSGLVEGVFAEELHGLSGRLDDRALFGITPEQVEAAQSAWDDFEGVAG